MEKQIGLWIDHKQAVIVILQDKREEIRKIHSNIQKPNKTPGGARTHAPYSAQYFKAERDRQRMEHLNRFYREVLASIRDAGSILIFGPGEAKRELQKQMRHERIQNRIAAIETSDKLTDRQFAAKVRKYFQKRLS
jgi:stalled ribosome rescue protein Dom34